MMTPHSPPSLDFFFPRVIKILNRSIPGEPYPVGNNTTPAPAPAPAPLFVVDVAASQNNHKAHVPYGWIIGSLGAGLALIIAVLGLFVCSRSSICFKDPEDEKASHKFRILRTTSFCCGSESHDCGEVIGESSDRHMNILKGQAFSLLLKWCKRISGLGFQFMGDSLSAYVAECIYKEPETTNERYTSEG